MQLTEDDVKILRTIHKMGKATAEELAKIFGEPYTLSDMLSYLHWLEKNNLLERVSNNPPTFKATMSGLMAMGILPKEAWKVFVNLPSEKRFHFYTGVGKDKSTGISACNLSDMAEKVKIVNVEALEFHFQRGDIERWIQDVLGDDKLAERIKYLREQNLKGEDLKNKLSNLIRIRCEELIIIKQ